MKAHIISTRNAGLSIIFFLVVYAFIGLDDSAEIVAQRQRRANTNTSSNQQADAGARDELYGRFHTAYEAARTSGDYQYAYARAKEYLERYGNDNDERTEYLARFVARYEEGVRDWEREQAFKAQKAAEREHLAVIVVACIVFISILFGLLSPSGRVKTLAFRRRL